MCLHSVSIPGLDVPVPYSFVRVYESAPMILPTGLHSVSITGKDNPGPYSFVRAREGVRVPSTLHDYTRVSSREKTVPFRFPRALTSECAGLSYDLTPNGFTLCDYTRVLPGARRSRSVPFVLSRVCVGVCVLLLSTGYCPTLSPMSLAGDKLPPRGQRPRVLACGETRKGT